MRLSVHVGYAGELADRSGCLIRRGLDLGDQLGLLADPLTQFGGRTRRHQPTFVDDDDSLTGCLDLGQYVAGQDHGVFLGEFADQ